MQESGNRLLRFLQNGVREGRLLGGERYSALNARFESGAFGSREGEAGRAYVRRICLRARDQSLIFAYLRAFGCFLLRGSLRSWGSFFLLSSVFCLLVQIALGRFSVAGTSFLVSVAISAASVLLLNSRRSLSHAIGRSALFSWLLFSLCAFPHDVFVFGGESGRDRPWITLLSSALAGALMGVTSPKIWILAAVAILLISLLIAVPELAFLPPIFLLPFFNLLPHATVWLAISVGVAFLLWGCKILCGHRETRRDLLGFFVFLFGVSILLGGIFGAGGSAAVRRGAILFLLLLSYFPMRDLFAKKQWRGRVLLLMTLSLLTVSLIGIAQYALGMAELKWVDVSRFSDIGGRVTAVLGNPNVLAVYLLLTLPVSLGVGMSRERPTGGRVLYWLATLSALICLVFTWSRGAWLGAIVAVLTFLLFCSKQTRKMLLWGLIPAIIWAPLLPHSVVNRFSSIGALAEGSIRYRLYTWQGTLRMIQAHPFGVGVGEEAWTSIYRRFAVSGTETVPHTHNLLLQITSELGVMGLFCFLVILVLLIRRIAEFLRLKRKTNGSSVVIGTFCALIGTLVMGFFDNVWYHYGLFWLFFVILGAMDGMVQTLTEGDMNDE